MIMSMIRLIKFQRQLLTKLCETFNHRSSVIKCKGKFKYSDLTKQKCIEIKRRTELRNLIRNFSKCSTDKAIFI